MSELEKSYGTKEIAEIAGVKVGTVRDWIVRHEWLPAFKVNDRWKVKESDLIEFLNRRMHR